MNYIASITKQLGTVLLTLLVVGLMATPLLAQEQPRKFLLLKRGSNQKSQIRFYPGEVITYKSKKIGYFVTDRIVNLDTEYLYLSENILNPSDIIAIDIRAKDPRNRLVELPPCRRKSLPHNKKALRRTRRRAFCSGKWRRENTNRTFSDRGQRTCLSDLPSNSSRSESAKKRVVSRK